MRNYVAVGLLCGFLSACLPVQSETAPSIALLNGPSEYRVTGLAEHFETVLKARPQASQYRFSPSPALRYQETHRNLYGSRAPLQAAFAARSQGATHAVLVGIQADTILVDTGLKEGGLEVEIIVSGEARASIIEAATATQLGTFSSPPVAFRLVETVAFSLPEGVDPESAEGERRIEQRAQEVKADVELRFTGDLEAPLDDLATPVVLELARLVSSQVNE